MCEDWVTTSYRFLDVDFGSELKQQPGILMFSSASCIVKRPASVLSSGHTMLDGY